MANIGISKEQSLYTKYTDEKSYYSLQGDKSVFKQDVAGGLETDTYSTKYIGGNGGPNGGGVSLEHAGTPDWDVFKDGREKPDPAQYNG